MATPVFIADTSTLKAALRLKDAASDQANVLIAGAMNKARVVIYDNLGSALTSAIIALVSNENPTTDDQLKRAKAENLEINLVRMFLLRTMPVLFQDSAAGAGESWQESPFARQSDARSTDREITRLDGEIKEAIEDLTAGAPDNSVISVENIGPDETNTRPGAGVFGLGRNLSLI